MSDRPYAPGMTGARRTGGAVSRMLDTVEAGSPVEAVEAVTRELGTALGASAVSFLIADMSGRALVRLAHADVDDSDPLPQGVGARRDEAESAELLPFDGGPVEKALRAQQVRLLPPGESYLGGLRAERWTVLAPVTERGEVLGLLEMSLHRPLRVGPAQHAVHPAR